MTRTRSALVASALAAALTVPLLASAPASATPPSVTASPVAVPMTPGETLGERTMVTTTGVNVRSGPGTSYGVVGGYAKGTTLTGTLTSYGWLKVANNRYVHDSNLKDVGSSEVTRYTRTAVNIRSGPSTNNSIVGSYAKGTKLTGTTSNGWLKVSSNRYVAESVLVSSPPSNGVTGEQVLAEGRKYFGIMYKWGGNTPAGFDCSGYTQYVYGQLGISIPRTASAQQAAATPVSNPQKGDLVFWGSPAHHVGIYAGDGYIYDSGRPGLPVQKRKIWSGVSGYGRAL